MKLLPSAIPDELLRASTRRHFFKPMLARRQIVSCERIDVRCVTHVVVSATDRTAAFARPSNA